MGNSRNAHTGNPQHPIHVIGGGGHAKVVIDALQQSATTVGKIFAQDPHTSLLGMMIEPLPPLLWGEDETVRAIIAIGNNRARQEISHRYPAVRWANAIHPSALIHPTVFLGVGVYVGAGVIIQPEARIGNHCIVNTGVIIEHDSVIHDYAHIAPRVTLTGAVEVGEGCLIGAGTTIIPQQTIGAWSLIGAGSTVINSIPSHSKAWGTPCRVHPHP